MSCNFTRYGHCLKAFFFGFQLLFLWMGDAYGQLHLRANPTPDDPVLCRGQQTTLWLWQAATLTGSAVVDITTEDLEYEYRECHFTGGCTVVNEPAINVQGAGIISNDVIVRKRCSTDPAVKSLIKIVVKPEVTTTYTISWSTKVYSSADPLCNRPRELMQEIIYTGEVRIEVVQPDPPVLTPQSLTINQFDNSHYIDATATYITNLRGIRWFTERCGEVQAEPIQVFYQGNTVSRSVDAGRLGRYTIRAQKFDNNCPSGLSDSAEITVKPCQLFNSGCNQDAVAFIESNSCNPAAAQRSDYHFYDSEEEVCSASCDIEALWRKYKTSMGNQVPNLADQLGSGGLAVAAKRMLLNRLFFTEPDNASTPITDCAEAFLPRPTTYLMGMAYQWNVGLGGVLLAGQAALTANPLSDRDPVFVRVDEASRCVVNYTKPGHALYPGKVTRCLVEECGVIKIKTFGEGVTVFGNGDWRGYAVRFANDIRGDLMFRNVSRRTKDFLNQPRAPETQPQHIDPMLPALVNKNWKIKTFRIRYPESDSLYDFYAMNDTSNFLKLRNLNVSFLDSNRYVGLDISGQQAEGYWSYDAAAGKLLTDTSAVDLLAFTDSTFSIKEEFPVMKMDSLKTALVYIDFVRKDFDSSMFTFTGSGDWDDPLNWLNQQKPPQYITYGTTVNIEPAGIDAHCIYTGNLYISKGAKIVVKDNAKFTVTGKIELQ